MINFIIVTHGEFGAYLVEAAESIVGRQKEGVRVLSVSARLGVVELRERLRKAVAQLACGDGLIVFTDMPAGTPMNVAFPAVQKQARAEIISGVNLYMLVSAFSHRERATLENLVAKVLRDGQSSIRDIRRLVESRVEPKVKA